MDYEKIASALVDHFEVTEAADGDDLDVEGVARVTDSTEYVAKTWLAFPPADLTEYLQVKRNTAGTKVVVFTPVRQAKRLIKQCLADSSDTGEIPTETMRSLLRAWAFVPDLWRAKIGLEVNNDAAKAIKHSTPRRAKVLSTIADAFSTFDPERREDHN